MGETTERTTGALSAVAWRALTAIFFVLVLLEGAIRVVLHHPALLRYLPNQVLSPLRDVYANQIRNIVQDDPRIVSYEPILFDRLRPGHFRFSNVEFNTTLDINSRGARDSESALMQPQIVLVGDSITMGWGLDENQTIAHVIEQRTGLKALNAGVSGYGTVRQLRFLHLLRVDPPRFLILQYGYYHVLENEAYFLNSTSLPVPDRRNFAARMNEYRRERGWRSQFYSLGFLHFVLFPHDNWNFSKPEKAHASVAELFLNVLQHELGPQFSRTQLIVFEIDHRGVDRFLIPELDHWLLNPPSNASPILKRIKTVHLQSVIHDNDFYVLDEHLSPRGAEKVARAISNIILKSTCGHGPRPSSSVP